MTPSGAFQTWPALPWPASASASASALPLSCPTTLRDPFLQPGIRRIAALIQAPQGRTTWPEDLQPVRPTLHEVPTYLTLL